MYTQFLVYTGTCPLKMGWWIQISGVYGDLSPENGRFWGRIHQISAVKFLCQIFRLCGEFPCQSWCIWGVWALVGCWAGSGSGWVGLACGCVYFRSCMPLQVIAFSGTSAVVVRETERACHIADQAKRHRAFLDWEHSFSRFRPKKVHRQTTEKVLRIFDNQVMADVQTPHQLSYRASLVCGYST